MNQGTALTLNGVTYYVTSEEHENPEVVNAQIGQVLSGAGGEYAVVDEGGEEVILIADAAPAGTGQRVRLAPVNQQEFAPPTSEYDVTTTTASTTPTITFTRADAPDV